MLPNGDVSPPTRQSAIEGEAGAATIWASAHVRCRRMAKVTLYRPGAEDPDPAPFFVDLARRAASGGHAVTRMGQQKPLSARLGGFDVADLAPASAIGSAHALPWLSAHRRTSPADRWI